MPSAVHDHIPTAEIVDTIVDLNEIPEGIQEVIPERSAPPTVIEHFFPAPIVFSAMALCLIFTTLTCYIIITNLLPL